MPLFTDSHLNASPIRPIETYSPGPTDSLFSGSPGANTEDEETGSLSSGYSEASSPETSSPESGVEESDFEESDFEESDFEESDFEESDVEESDVEESDVEESDVEESGVEESSSQGSESQRAEDLAAQDSQAVVVDQDYTNRPVAPIASTPGAFPWSPGDPMDLDEYPGVYENDLYLPSSGPAMPEHTINPVDILQPTANANTSVLVPLSGNGSSAQPRGNIELPKDTPEITKKITINKDGNGNSPIMAGADAKIPNRRGKDRFKIVSNRDRADERDRDILRKYNETQKLIKSADDIAKRRERSRPGSIYNMEVDLLLPFHLNKVRPREIETRAREIKEQVQNLVREEWSKDGCCDNLGVLNYGIAEEFASLVRWKSDVEFDQKHVMDEAYVKGRQSSLPYRRFRRQLWHVACLLIDEDRDFEEQEEERARRGKRRGNGNGCCCCVATAFTEDEVITHLMELGIWKTTVVGGNKKNPLKRGPRNHFVEAYDLVRSRWKEVGVWRRRWDGEHFPNGVWMHQEELDHVLREEMGDERYKRFREATTGESLPEILHPLPPLSAAETALCEEMSCARTARLSLERNAKEDAVRQHTLDYATPRRCVS